MTKTVNKKAPQKAKSKVKQPKRAATPRQRTPSIPGLAAYDRLIRDPCGAPLVHPPYVGSGSGYLCRTVENFTVTDTTKAGLVIGAATTGNASIAIAPGNYSTSTGYAWSPNGAAASVFGRTVFPVTSAAVRKFRPVAACLKWVPFGNYGARAGVVGLGYANGSVITAGTTIDVSTFLSAQLESAPNGAKIHEVRWIPTQDDQGWKSQTDTGTQGNGTLTLALYNIDAVATAATVATLNGFVEMTVVWEWMPEEGNTAAGGLSQAPTPAVGFTVNDHQRTIGDIGMYLLNGIRGAAAHATEGFVMGLSRGVGQMRRQAPAMRFLT